MELAQLLCKGGFGQVGLKPSRQAGAIDGK